MKVHTKALLAVLVVTALSLQALPTTAASDTIAPRMKRQVERVQRHHDRKLELRAATLHMEPDELKKELQTKSIEQILKEHGFNSKDAFYQALQGKVKEELKKRGLSDEQVEQVLEKRLQRLQLQDS